MHKKCVYQTNNMRFYNIIQLNFTNPWLLDFNPSSALFKCKYLRSSDVNDEGKV